MKTFYIYALTEPFDANDIRYVGCTSDLIQRFRTHLSASEAVSPKADWVRELKKTGLVPCFLVLEQTDKANATRRELYWINRYAGPRLFNVIKPTMRSSIPLIQNPITFKDVEKNHLLAALEKYPNNKTHLAHYLGISRPTLYDMLKRHGINLINPANAPIQ